jgi:hypothetical protein
MPAFIKTKEDEELWQRAKDAVVDQYGDIEKSDPEKFFSIVTSVYKNMCKKHECSPFKNESISRKISELLERIAKKQNVTSIDTNKEMLLKFYNNYKSVADQLWKDGTDKNSDGYSFMQDNPKVLEKWRSFRDAFDIFLRSVWDAGKHIDIKAVHDSSSDVNETDEWLESIQLNLTKIEETRT